MILTSEIQQQFRARWGIEYDVFLDGQTIGHRCMRADDEAGTVECCFLKRPYDPEKGEIPLIEIDYANKCIRTEILFGKVEFRPKPFVGDALWRELQPL